MVHKFGRRSQVLGALVLVLAVAAAAPYGYRTWQAANPPAGASRSVVPDQERRPRPAASDQAGTLPTVRLDLVEPRSPTPVTIERNPFRFEERPVRPIAPLPAPPAPASAPGPSAGSGSGPSARPPIPLKFIGLVEGPAGAGKLAVLSDGRFVYHGREGDIIDGRYRLVRIGVESVVLEYLDGQGRQAIRLSGS